MSNSLNLTPEIRAWAEEMFGKIDAKMSKMTIRSRNKIPDGVDENGVHKDRFEEGKKWFNKNWWCNGFWGGLNYMLWAYTKNEEYLKTGKRSEELMDQAMEIAKNAIEECFDRGIDERNEIKNSVKNALSRFILQTTGRKPMILPIIMDV